MTNLMFKQWIEGLWLNDANAETTGTGVRAQRKSKQNTQPTGGGMGGMGTAPGGGIGLGGAMGGGMGTGGGLSLPPR